MEGTRTRRPRKRWSDEVEGDLNIIEMKKGQAMDGGRQEWSKILLEAKVHNGHEKKFIRLCPVS